MMHVSCTTSTHSCKNQVFAKDLTSCVHEIGNSQLTIAIRHRNIAFVGLTFRIDTTDETNHSQYHCFTDVSTARSKRGAVHNCGR